MGFTQQRENVTGEKDRDRWLVQIPTEMKAKNEVRGFTLPEDRKQELMEPRSFLQFNEDFFTSPAWLFGFMSRQTATTVPAGR
jgi:hypothetical protein